MAPSNGGVAAGSHANPGPPFSYAQAAKGNATTPSSVSATTSKPPMSARQSKESISTASTNPATESRFSWADDAADANTLVDNGTPRGSPNQTMLNESKGPAFTAHSQSEATTRVESDAPVPIGDGSVIEEPHGTKEPVQLSRSAKDSDWRRRSSATDKDTKQKTASSTSPQNAHQEGQEKPAQKLLTAAPLPAVNVWAQRAQERQPKKNIETPPAGLIVNTRSAINEPRTLGTPDVVPKVSFVHGLQKAQIDSNPQMTESKPDEKSLDQRSNLQYDQQAWDPKQTHYTNRLDGPSPKSADWMSRTQSQPSSIISSTPERAAVVDTVNWPTPETAQEEVSRKPSEKFERPEHDRGPSHPPKNHGKQEWVHVPFIPTVKFQTPIPSSRRGVRGGGRGSRGVSERGALSHASISRSGFSAAAADPAEGQAETHRRGRAGSTSVMSSSTLRGRSARRPVSAHGIRTTSLPSTQDPQMHQFANRIDASSNHGKSAVDGDQHSQEAQIPTSHLQDDSSEVSKISTWSDDRKTSGQESESISAQNRRRSIATQTVPSHEPADRTSSSNRKRGGFLAINPAEASATRPADRKRSGSNTHKAYMQDHRPEVPSYPYDIHGVFPNHDRNDLRPDRPRGGRGGRGGFAHAHASAQLQVQTEFSANQNMGPASSSKTPSFQPFSAYPSNSRTYRPSPRSAPILTDSPYARAMPEHPPSAQPSSYYSGSYSYSGPQSVPALQHDPYLQQMILMNGVANQLNHYFSIDNLCKDIFLRKHMDSQGFVSLKFVAGFARMKQLSEDFEFIKSIVNQSPDFEMRNGFDGMPRIRRRTEWEKFVLNMDDRDPSARNDGPLDVNQYFSPSQSAQNAAVLNVPLNGVPYLPTQANDLRSPHSLAFNNFAPMPTASPFNGPARSPPERHSASGVEPHSGYIPSPHKEPRPQSPAPNQQQKDAFDDPDTFPDEQVDLLTIYSRVLDQGSVKSISPSQQRQDSFEAADRSPTSSGQLSETKVSESCVEEYNGSPESRKIHSNSKRPQLFFLKGNQSPEPSPTGSGQEPYNLLRAKALNGRIVSSKSQSIYDVNLLYMFWSHFLVSNFNTGMYKEFRRLAIEDARSHIPTEGMNSLLKFFSDSLTSTRPIRRRLAHDFIDLVRSEHPLEDGTAFKQLRHLLRNGELDMKNLEIMMDMIDPEIRAKLER